jgi:membrane fusion protein, multidrug efflux system
MKRNILIATIVMMVIVFYGCGSSNTAEAKNDSQAVEKQVAEAIKVTVKTMSHERFEHYFQANGSVEAVQDAFISPELNGQVKKVYVKDGQRVNKGQPLISLNSEVIESGIAEVKSALELASTIYKKRKGLWEKKIGSEIQFLESKTNKDSLENKLKSLKAQLRMAHIKAPFSGIVDKVFIKEGELAAPGLQLMQIVNLKKVYINADVSESYLPRVNKGDHANVMFPTYPELAMEAEIHRTGNVIKIQNRTFQVQLLLDNPGEKLKPNIIAIIKMMDYSEDYALLVPSIIIKNDLTGSYLYVAEKDEKSDKTVAKKIYVTPGMSEGSSTLVNKGLKTGQQVIVKGYNLVKNGMTVQIIAPDKK